MSNTQHVIPAQAGTQSINEWPQPRLYTGSQIKFGTTRERLGQ